MNYYPDSAFSRRGTILIIVAGISALLASLSLTFLLRNRSDAQESELLVRDVQARLMLFAACNYIQETSRLGWDRWNYATGTNVVSMPLETINGSLAGSRPIHDEGFGWIDVRDGRPGPITADGYQVWSATTTWTDDQGVARPAWPAPKSIVRCRMEVLNAPKWGTALTVAYNPMATSLAAGASGFIEPDMPYLKKPDPLPYGAPTNYVGGAGTYDVTLYNNGDPTVRTHTAGKAWFRVLREDATTGSPACFVLTCGAGGTLGYRSWREVTLDNAQGLFNNDPAYFAALQHSEIRMWYRVEWSPAGPDQTFLWAYSGTSGHTYDKYGNELTGWKWGEGLGYKSAWEHYIQYPYNASQTPLPAGHYPEGGRKAASSPRNFGGTFRWIQRLRTEPTYW